MKSIVTFLFSEAVSGSMQNTLYLKQLWLLSAATTQIFFNSSVVPCFCTDAYGYSSFQWFIRDIGDNCIRQLPRFIINLAQVILQPQYTTNAHFKLM